MATDLISLNRVRYSGLDFDTIEDDLRAQLQIKFASVFNDFSVSSLGIVLMDIVAFGLDTLSFYLDRRATDTYLATARSRTAVSLLTRQLGYKMTAAVASSVDIEVAAAQLYAFALPIPARFQFKGPNGAIFETAQAVTIPPSSLTPVTVPCYQGQTITETFTSDGTPNQVFQLTRVPTGWAIVQGSVTCTVNASPFTESDFLTFDETDQFEIGYNDTPPTVRFGDGVAGNIPVLNGSIAVTYVATLGASGQVLSNTITDVVTQLVVMFTTISLSVNNPSASVGGSDLEDLQHAKTFAPLVFKSRQVAVTAGDYRALAGAYADPLFGRVAVAEAISSRSAETDIELQNRLIDIEDNLNISTLVVQNNAGFNSWASTTIFETGAYIVPSPGNGYYYQAFNTGTTGALAPNFPTVTGASVSDGTLVWTCQGAVIAGSGLALTTTIAAAVTQALTDDTNILNQTTTIYTNEGQILSLARSVQGDSQQIQTDYGDASSTVTVAKALVNGFPVGSSSTISAVDRDTLITYLNTINSLLGLINGLASNTSATATSQVSIAQNNQQLLNFTVGITSGTSATPGSLLADLATQLASIQTAAGSDTSPYSGLFLALRNILGATSTSQANIVADTGAIFDHVNGLLSADCKANLVSVPILAIDASGFYAPPSIGLINSLQHYLDGIKEVTQTVVVASGQAFLVPACITVRLGVNTGTSLTVTAATAQTIIDGILIARPFGASLYLSDLVNPLRSQLTGVSFVNVTINGYRPINNPSILSDKLDGNGNLIIAANEVVTLSQADLVIRTEVFTGITAAAS